MGVVLPLGPERAAVLGGVGHARARRRHTAALAQPGQLLVIVRAIVRAGVDREVRDPLGGQEGGEGPGVKLVVQDVAEGWSRSGQEVVAAGPSEAAAGTAAGASSTGAGRVGGWSRAA